MPRPRSDIEPRIVLSARRCFLEQGVDGASLRAVAKGAGTSIGMVYYYFKTKDDLFFAVVEETYAKLLSDMTEALSPDAPIDERLRRLYLRIAAASPTEVETVQLVAREALVSTSRRDRLIERFLAGHIPLVLQALAEGVSQGSVDQRRPLSLLAMATLALGVLPQFIRRAGGDRLPLHDWPETSAMAAELVDLLFHGIAPRAASPPLPAAAPRAAADRPRASEPRTGSKGPASRPRSGKKAPARSR
jgi:AcrR family transcriptional regulator